MMMENVKVVSNVDVVLPPIALYVLRFIASFS